MDLHASHTGFVIAAYLLSGGVLAGLVVGTYLVLRARQRALARLEGQGAPRRRRPT